MKKMFGIYVHIPFCVKKCAYCSFVSFENGNQNVKEYINFLCNEIVQKKHLASDNIVTSIYFGGGTPSFILKEYIKQILDCIRQNYSVSKDAEISIECNPCSTTKDKLMFYRQIGINRISFGVQSLNNNTLSVLGRKHNRDMAINVINLAKIVGFNNISCDLMIGVPNQTQSDVIEDVKTLINLPITHISTYMLMLEENTPLFNLVKSGNLKVADDDICVDMYNAVFKVLKQNDFSRYEISNFAKENKACRHNLNYWQMGEYLGFGVSAHSFLGGVRFSNSNSLQNYYNNVKDLEDEKLTNKEIIEETIMLGLRQKNGINLNNLKKLGCDLLTEKSQEIKMLIDNNFIGINNNRLYIKEKHFGVCSKIILMII